jgi:hypothetical protein
MNEVMQVEEPITTADLAGRIAPKNEAVEPLLPADFCAGFARSLGPYSDQLCR